MRKYLPILALLFALASPAGAKPLVVDRIQGTEPLLPYFTWLPDPAGAHTIESVTSGSLQEHFSPLRGGLPLKGKGPVWLRLSFMKSAPSADERGAPLVMNLGMLPPGKITLYLPAGAGPAGAVGAYTSETVLPHESIPLPAPGLFPASLYIRMDEYPGLWFAPVVNGRQASPPPLLPPDLLLPGLLALSLAACLLRAARDRAVWPLWAALFAACVLAQALLPPPRLGAPFSMRDLPALLAPGMALLLLPHIGRCMFSAGGPSPLRDAMLSLHSLMGAALCLVPLVPGMEWLARLFLLWPLLLVPLLPLCLGALARKSPGALSFTGACVMPVLGAAAALYAIDHPAVHPLAPYGGLWGLAVGAIGLALARVPAAGREKAASQDGAALSLENAAALPAGESETAAPLSGVSGEPARSGGLASMDLSLGGAKTAVPDMALFGKPGEPLFPGPAADPVAAARQPENGLPKNGGPEPAAPEPAAPAELVRTAPAGTPAPFEELEQPIPLEDVFAPAPAGSPSPLPPGGEKTAPEGAGPSPAGGEASPAPQGAVRSPAGGEAPLAKEASGPAEEKTFPDVRQPAPAQTAPLLVPACIDEGAAEMAVDALLAEVEAAKIPSATRIISLEDDAFSGYAEDILDELRGDGGRRFSLAVEKSFIFNLSSLVREVHDVVSPLAKSKGLIFSWFISPSLPSLLEGDAPRLRQALSLLLQNAVQATRQGSVQLAVRNNPTGDDPGDLLFTIHDNGSAQRTDAGFFHAWDLASRTGGSFHVEYSPSLGTRVTFSIRFSLPHYLSALERAAFEEHLPEGEDIPPLTAAVPDAFLSAPAPAEREHEAPAASGVEEAVFTHDGGVPGASRAAPEEASGVTPGAANDKEKRVLIADTTTSNRRLLSHYLCAAACAPVETAGGHTLLERFREAAPALVIFDADMPEADIRASIAALRAEEKQRNLAPAPLLALVSHEAQTERMRAAGCTATLPKPFTGEALKEAVCGLLRPKGSGPSAPEAPPFRDVPEFPAESAFPEKPARPSSELGESPAGPVPAASEKAAPAAPDGSTFPDLGALPDLGESPLPDLGAALSEAPAETGETPPAATARPVDLLAAALEKAPAAGALPVREVSLPAPDREPEGRQAPSTGLDLPPLPPSREALRIRAVPTITVTVPGRKAPPAPGNGPLSFGKPAPVTPGDERLSLEAPGDALLSFGKPESPAPGHEPLSLGSAGAPGTGRARERADSPEAAPLLLTLSADDVTPPAERGVPLLDLIITGEETERNSAGGEAPGPEPVALRPETPPQASPKPAENARPDRRNAAPGEAGPATPQEDAAEPRGRVFALPGMEGEAVEVIMMPLLPGLIHALRDALEDSLRGRDARETVLVQEAAGRLAGKAEVFGLRKLGKIARCVERAAEADDMEASATLLEDLNTVTQRYLTALHECYQAFLNIER